MNICIISWESIIHFKKRLFDDMANSHDNWFRFLKIWEMFSTDYTKCQETNSCGRCNDALKYDWHTYAHIKDKVKVITRESWDEIIAISLLMEFISPNICYAYEKNKTMSKQKIFVTLFNRIFIYSLCKQITTIPSCLIEKQVLL